MRHHLLNRIYAKVFRALSGLGVAQRIAINLPLRVGEARFRIPVIQRVGLGNVTHGDWWLEDILGKLLPLTPGAFLDVGANVGQTLLKVKSWSRERPWIGFEPNPACAMYLHALIKANRFESCTVIPAGLGNHAGVSGLDCFHEDPADATASLVSGFRPNDRVLRKLWVPVVEFAMLTRAGIDAEIGFIKIDVEGGEREVMESLHAVMERFRPFVVLEILPVYSEQNLARLSRQQAVERQVRSLDYTICRVEKQPNGHCMGLRPFEQIGVHDQLVWSDYLLVPSEKLAPTLALVGRAERPGVRDTLVRT